MTDERIHARSSFVVGRKKKNTHHQGTKTPREDSQGGQGGKGGKTHFVGGILEMPIRPKAEKKNISPQRHRGHKGEKMQGKSAENTEERGL
jgi:hypothetical protein